MQPHPAAAPSSPAAPSRRRRSLRRWGLRALLWTLAGAIVLLLTAQQLLDAPRTRAAARAQIADALTAALGRDVTVREVRLTLVPTAIELSGVQIGADAPLPLLDVPWAVIDIRWRALLEGRLHLDGVRLERPILRLESGDLAQAANDDASGAAAPGDDAPASDDSAASDDGRIAQLLRRITVDHLRIAGGRALVDEHHVGIDADADGVDLDLSWAGARNDPAPRAVRLTLDRLAVWPPRGPRLTMRLRAHAELDDRGVQLSALHVRSDAVQLTGSGRYDWRSTGAARADDTPAVDASASDAHRLLQLEGRLAPSWLAAVGGLDGQFTGTPIHFDGTLTLDGANTRWRGQARTADLWLGHRRLQAVRSTLQIDPGRVAVLLDDARHAGGRLTGEVIHADGALAIAVEAEALDLRPLLDDLGLGALRLDAVVDGPLQYRCALHDPYGGDGRAALRLRRADVVDSDRASVDGQINLRAAEGRIRADAADVRDDAQRARFDLMHDLRDGRTEVRYDVASSDVAQLVPLIPGLRSVGDVPWRPTAGAGTLRGDVAVARDGRYVVRTALDLRAVRTPVLDVDHRTRGQITVADDAVELRDLTLADGRGALALRGRIPFGADATALTLTADAVDWPTARTHPWLPASVPVDQLPSGSTTSGRLRLDSAESGTLQATLRTADAHANAWHALDTAALDLVWDAARIDLRNLALTLPAGTIRGRGHIDHGAAPSAWPLDITLRGDALAFDRAPLDALVDILPQARGDLRADLRLRGTLDAPEIDVALEAAALTIGDDLRGPMRWTGAWSDGQLVAHGHLFDRVHLRGGGPWTSSGADLRFRVDGERLGALAQATMRAPDRDDAPHPTDPPPIDGALSGTLIVHGARATSHARWTTTAALTLDRAQLDVPIADAETSDAETPAAPAHRRQLILTAPATIGLAPDRFWVDDLQLIDAHEDAPGTIDLSGRFDRRRGALDGRIAIDRLDARWWTPILAPLGLRPEAGAVDLDAVVGGTPAQPTLDGTARMRLTRAAVALDPLTRRVDDLDAVMRLTPGAVVLERLSADLAGGRVEASGRADLPGHASSPQLQIQLVGRELVGRTPDGWQLAGDVDLALRTAASDGARSTMDGGSWPMPLVLSGRAELTRAHFVDDLPVRAAEQLRGLLARATSTAPVAAAGGGSNAVDPRSALTLDIAVQVPDDRLRVRNNVADLRGAADLVLRGTLARPTLAGVVDTRAGGRLRYNGTDFRLQRGRLTFADPTGIRPELDLEADARIRAYDVSLALSGPLDRLDTRFTADPPLPDLEVLRLVATGEDSGGAAGRVVAADRSGAGRDGDRRAARAGAGGGA
ncbi:MAG: translocation/assembly module TamB domain-containing protein, partial [Acidobacteriota bacterium]